jgi:outer membrane immunogenic protein
VKKLTLSIAAAVSLGLGQFAFAADMPRAPYYSPPPMPQVFNWTGFYVGSHIGYGMADRTDFEADGFIGGVQAGFNWQMSPNWVFGVEADISGTDISTVVAGTPIHVDYLGTLRGRVGYAWDRTMFYGTFGLAYGRMGGFGVHVSDVGYALGTGIEWAFNSAWTAKVEYMYYEFGDGFSAFDTTAQTIKVGMNYRFGL